MIDKWFKLEDYCQKRKKMEIESSSILQIDNFTLGFIEVVIYCIICRTIKLRITAQVHSLYVYIKKYSPTRDRDREVITGLCFVSSLQNRGGERPTS